MRRAADLLALDPLGPMGIGPRERSYSRTDLLGFDPLSPIANGSNSEHTSERHDMRIVVVGGTGLIGSKLVTRLDEGGHEAIAASPDSGVNTLTGDGLAAAPKGATVVVAVADSPSLAAAAVVEVF